MLTLLASWGDQWWTPRDIKLLKAQLWKLLTFLKAQLPHTYVNLLALSDEPHTLEDVQAESMWCRTQVRGGRRGRRGEVGPGRGGGEGVAAGSGGVGVSASAR